MTSNSTEEREDEFVHHKPLHPLPKELQSMTRDETVCQFCGVSYLIHNEIAKLQEQIEKYRKELEHYRGYDERENKLKRDLSTLQDKHESAVKRLEGAEDVIRLKEETLRSIETDNRKLQKMCNESQHSVQSYLTKLQKIHNGLKIYKNVVNEIKDSQNIISKEQVKLKSTVTEVLQMAQRQLKKLVSRQVQQEDDWRQENDKITKALAVAREERENALLEVNRLKNVSDVVSQKEEKIRLTLALNETIGKELDTIQKDCVLLKEKNITLSGDNDRLQFSLSEKTNKLEEMNLELQSKSKTLQELQKTTEETLARKEQEIGLLNQRCSSYQQQINDLADTQVKVRNVADTSTAEVNVLKKKLQEAKEELNMLKVERDKMVDAHQNRIQQLRESFLEKMSEAEAWPRKLEDKLKEQQQKFIEEKNQLWKELSQSYGKGGTPTWGQSQQGVVDKYNNIRKEKLAEKMYLDSFCS